MKIFFNASKDYTHIHTDVQFFICNQNEPLTFHVSILLQHSLKGPNKLYS